MKDDEIVKVLQGDAKWVKRISWQNAPTGGSAEFLKVSGRIVEAATRIEQLAKENAELKERNYELDDALRDMVGQFSTHDGKLKHSFMSAEENAYCVLNLEYGASVQTLWENRPQPPEKGEVT